MKRILRLYQLRRVRRSAHRAFARTKRRRRLGIGDRAFVERVTARPCRPIELSRGVMGARRLRGLLATLHRCAARGHSSARRMPAFGHRGSSARDCRTRPRFRLPVTPLIAAHGALLRDLRRARRFAASCEGRHSLARKTFAFEVSPSAAVVATLLVWSIPHLAPTKRSFRCYLRRSIRERWLRVGKIRHVPLFAITLDRRAKNSVLDANARKTKLSRARDRASTNV
jgi:hypothetical protein